MAFSDSAPIPARQRLGSIGLIAALHGLALWLLIAAFGIDAGQISQPVQSALQTVLMTDPPPPAPPPPDGTDAGEEGAPSEAGKKADATPVVAPEIEMPSENPVPAAIDPLEGLEPETGQTDLDADGAGSDLAGDSTGTGDSGSGPGAGGSGSGTGAGAVTPPVKVAGTIKPKDFRKATGFSAISGEVVVDYTVQANGRVTGCTIRQGSGNSPRDRLTCQLIEQRWRYRPARDEAGKPVPYETGWRQRWWPEPDFRPPPGQQPPAMPPMPGAPPS